MKKILLTFTLLFISLLPFFGQDVNLTYAYLSDTHIAENSKSIEELRPALQK